MTTLVVSEWIQSIHSPFDTCLARVGVKNIHHNPDLSGLACDKTVKRKRQRVVKSIVKLLRVFFWIRVILTHAIKVRPPDNSSRAIPFTIWNESLERRLTLVKGKNITDKPALNSFFQPSSSRESTRVLTKNPHFFGLAER